MELGVLLIPVLILLSGAIALVGNTVGRNIGRRRLTLFGLRPRYTAQLITVGTGMLITVVTLIVVLLFSREARVALFRLNEVLRETTRLEAEIKRQQDRLKQLALGDIAYLTNQEVVREVIDARLAEDVVRTRVDALVARAGELARANGIGVDGSGDSVLLSPPNVTWDAIASLLDQRDAETVVRLVAGENTLRGEPLVVFVQMFDNRLIYPAGTVLATATIDGRQAREAIERSLLRMGDQVGRRARGSVVSPPFGIVTSPPSAIVDIDEHRGALARIQRSRAPVRVRIVAARDTFTVGPLLVAYRVGR